ncbi:MAG TPA: ABC transporter substrate-binding protein [Burkholderiales bacterium]|nr:ABC transporter substrate-binding protein [Burkholderiales bacterium]
MGKVAGSPRPVRPHARRHSTRRTFLAATAAWPALAWIEPVLGQPKPKPAIVGWLSLGSRESAAYQLAALKEGLVALGYREGQQFAIEGRWAESRLERLQSLAEELVARKPAVIVAVFLEATNAAAKAAPATPIVAVGGGIERRTESLARPGGMVTGVADRSMEYREKYVELLVAAVPGLKRIGVLVRDVRAPTPVWARLMEAARRSAAQHKVELRFEGADAVEEIEPAVSRLDKQGVEALIVFSTALFLAEAARIAKLARAKRWPLAGSPILTVHTEPGALLTYGAEPKWQFLRAAHYVDRILKGAKPGDLPIEQPTKFELVVNLKNAKALGLTIPQPFLMRADRVIE